MCVCVFFLLNFWGRKIFCFIDSVSDDASSIWLDVVDGFGCGENQEKGEKNVVLRFFNFRRRKNVLLLSLPFEGSY